MSKLKITHIGFNVRQSKYHVCILQRSLWPFVVDVLHANLELYRFQTSRCYCIETKRTRCNFELHVLLVALYGAAITTSYLILAMLMIRQTL